MNAAGRLPVCCVSLFIYFSSKRCEAANQRARVCQTCSGRGPLSGSVVNRADDQLEYLCRKKKRQHLVRFQKRSEGKAEVKVNN